MRAETFAWVLTACLLFSVAGCTERAGPADHPDVGVVAMDVGAADAGRGDASGDTGGGGCRSDAQCADRFACTIDHCNAGVCDHVACTDCCGTGRSCDVQGGCGPTPMACTTDAECMDAQPCTLDACRGNVCRHEPMDGLCPNNHICIVAQGCTPRPPAHCTTDADCNVIGFCYGTWQCAGEVGCAFVAPTSCDDTDACTANRCDGAAGACVHEGRDADGNRHVDATCAGGDDCDDAVMSTHPGATEACNSVNDDCDMRVDEGCCASGPCTTMCGSMGMTACNPDGTVGACMPPAEICNGVDDDCDGTRDEGFDCIRGASAGCSASCGSTGTSVCDLSCHAGACGPPAETCNGMDDDCVAGPDNGLGCVLGSTMPCPTGCGSMGTQTCIAGCTYGACAPPPETCNGLDDNCNGARDDGVGACYAGEMRLCTSFTGMGFVSGTATCRSDCSGFDLATCSRCGNNAIDAGEACDGVALGGATCTSRMYAAGTLRCAPGCVFDESGCTHCGDGDIDTGEQCDGAALNGATCASLGTGFTGGNLRCHGPGASMCTYDTGMCARCGNGLVETGEVCDGGVGTATCNSVRRGYVGTLRCGSTCTSYDTSMCTWSPSGIWTLSPPGVNQYCGLGGVDFNWGNMTFADTGSVLSVSGGGGAGINCTMTGASARVSRVIDVSCAITCTGSFCCNEAYRLTGTFTGDNTFSGSFTATFNGPGCFDCTTSTTGGLMGSR